MSLLANISRCFAWKVNFTMQVTVFFLSEFQEIVMSLLKVKCWSLRMPTLRIGPWYVVHSSYLLPKGELNVKVLHYQLLDRLK